MAEEPTILWCCQSLLYSKASFKTDVTFPQIAISVKVKVKLTLEQATKAHSGSDIALLFL